MDFAAFCSLAGGFWAAAVTLNKVLKREGGWKSFVRPGVLAVALAGGLRGCTPSFGLELSILRPFVRSSVRRLS
jgi:hypothetical protein